MSTKRGEGLNKSFIRNVEVVFDEQSYDELVEEQYQGMVVRPFYEREAVERFEREVEFAN